jgi:hypothetical protein
MNTLYGFQVMLSAYLTESYEVSVPRSAWERWTSWPWRPWVTTRTEVRQRPYRGFLKIGKGNQIVMHPAIFAEIEKAGFPPMFPPTNQPQGVRTNVP